MALKPYRQEWEILTITVLVGAGGVLGQLLLLRELLVVFQGNEITLGIILGNWVALEALGAILAGRLPYNLCRKFYLLGIFLYPLVLILSLYYSRGIQYTIFGQLYGEAAGIIIIIASSLIILALPSFVHGSLFTLASRLLRLATGASSSAPGRVYLFETIGSLASGLLFSLILAPLYTSMQLSFALLLMHLVASVFLLKNSLFRKGLKLLTSAIIIVSALFLLFFINPFSDYLHKASLSRQWPGQDLVHYENSPYGNLVVSLNGGEYTLYYNGRPFLTAPNPDRVALEDLYHLAAGAHRSPERIMLIGGGAGGGIETILLHPVKSLDYVELDPRLPALLLELPFDRVHIELKDHRVNTVAKDARLYIQGTDTTYDLIVMGFITPDSLQENRLFTSQFFSLVRKRLAPGGLFVFTAPGSALRLTPEIQPLLASLYQTASVVFPHVKVLPGEMTIFYASESPLFKNHGTIFDRLSERGLIGGFINELYLENRFDELRVVPIEEGISSYNVASNEDFRPVAFYYSLYHWGGLFSPSIFTTLRNLEKIPFIPLACVFILLLMFFLSRLALSRDKVAVLPFAVFSSGVSGMGFDLLIIFIFQALYGYVYQMLGILVALFMAGAALGSAWGIKIAAGRKAGCRLVAVELTTVLFHPALYFFALLLQANLEISKTVSFMFFSGLFAVFGGSLVGAHFPLSVSLAGKKFNPGEPSGLLYASDLLGGWVGGLLISILFFPLLGLGYTLLLLGLFKTSSLILTTKAFIYD